MATVREICSFLVDKGIESGKPVSQISLQKLLYFAQGVALAAFDEKLFEDEIQAWQFGPVVPSVYDQFKLFGAAPMHKEAIDIVMGTDFTQEKEKLSEKDKQVLEFVWKSLGNKAPFELVAMTHADRSPWSDVRREHGENTRNVAIPEDSMKRYFKGILKKKES